MNYHYINHQFKLSKNRLLLLLVILLFICLTVSLLLGSINIPVNTVLSAINPFQSSASGNYNNQNLQLIIEKIRLPRALLAVLVGGVLGISGAVSQGLFRNPLADPSLIGVSAGASIGAIAMIFLGINISANLNTTTSIKSLLLANSSTLGISMVSIGAFVTALLTVLIVYRLSTFRNGNTSVATMLLAGIAITALAGGITGLIEYASDNTALRNISLWRMGGLDGANYSQVIIMTVVCFIISLGFFYQSTNLNALLLGESEARHLGIAVQKTKILLIVLVAFGVGTAVSVSGGIGFIGLIVPHIMRMIIGPNHKHLLPASLLAGAMLLLTADTFARTIMAPTEIPVGVVTALIGAPFFISLLRSRHRYGMQEG